VTALVLSVPASARRRLLIGGYYAAGLGILLALSIWFLRREESEWENVYVRAAHQLRNGRDIYQAGISYSYPPFATLLALPFTWLPAQAQRPVWLAVNLSALALMLRSAWRLAGGPPLNRAAGLRPRERSAALLGGVCGIFYLHNCLAHQQTDIVLGAMVVAGCLALSRERPLLAATWFGLAAAMKCTPLLWCPYLVWRRRPVAAAWLVAVAFGANLLPDVVRPPGTGSLWLAEYATRILAPLNNGDHVIGTWHSAVVYNQSLDGAAHRWFMTTWEWTATDCVISYRTGHLGPLALRAVGFVMLAGVVSPALVICRRPFKRLGRSEAGSVGSDALEYGIVLTLMLLCSPMSSKAHFGVLILPGFCLGRAVVVEKRRRLWPLLVAAVLLAVMVNKGPLGERLYTLSLWCGCATWHALLLLGASLIQMKLRGGDAAAEMPSLSSGNEGNTSAPAR
jgi:hypothetical protein